MLIRLRSNFGCKSCLKSDVRSSGWIAVEALFANMLPVIRAPRRTFAWGVHFFGAIAAINSGPLNC